jgi:hypothetical protein
MHGSLRSVFVWGSVAICLLMGALDSCPHTVAQEDAKLEWTVLEPKEFKAASTASLKLLLDHSLLIGGDNPPTDTYTVEAVVNLKQITALRLEVMTDENLPGNGPGRVFNGNFVLTDFRASVGGKPVKFKTATASFNQDGHPVTLAIDADPKSGWAVHPQGGKPHTAFFQLEQPLTLEANAKLTILLDSQSSFAQHQLGRFRLAASQ